MTKTARRHADLRRTLSDRRREIRSELRARMRGGRTDRSPMVGDQADQSDAHLQEDIELALLKMRAETLTRIDAALVRLDAGTYGFCFECEREIAERRLRALPFAVRCQSCEEKREQEHGTMQRLAQRGGSSWLFPDVVGS